MPIWSARRAATSCLILLRPGSSDAADKGLARNPFALGGAMLLAEAVILLMGAGWMAYLFGLEKAIAFGFGAFIVGDLVKLALAACGVPAMMSLLKR